MANEYTYRADHVGRLIAPAALIKARRQHDAGRIDAARLREAEDAAIKSAADMQRSSGIAVMTDGGLRRGCGTVATFDGSTLARSEAAFLRTLSRRAIKVAVPAARPAAGEPIERALGRADIVKREIEALVAAGVDYIQLDAPGYSGLFDNVTDGHGTWSLDEMLRLDMASLAGIERPAHVRIAVYFGGPRNAALRSAKNRPDDVERVFLSLSADRFVLPMENADGAFELLSLVPKGRLVALGLVSAEKPSLEDVDHLMLRIDQAAEHIDGDNLALSTATGFVAGGEISESDQRRKLELIADVATRWWGFAM